MIYFLRVEAERDEAGRDGAVMAIGDIVMAVTATMVRRCSTVTFEPLGV